MEWAVPSFSRTSVDRAGDVLRDSSHSDITAIPDRDRALNVMNDWRAAHAFPMNSIQMTLRGRARSISSRANVYQRLKRHPSIELKLQRFPHMALSQMQDIGGCRAVMPSVKMVEALAKRCSAGRGRGSFITDIDHYINEPKKDGYRGVHLIYKYRATKEHLTVYNGLRVEVQLRSRLQHLWATAVETIDLFEGQEIKFGGGEEDWRRFFALMAHTMALEEGCVSVPDMPDGIPELKNEIRHWAHELNVIETLDAAQSLLTWDRSEEDAKAKVFLLKVDMEEKRIEFRGFGRRAEAISSPLYLKLEKEAQDNPRLWVVFVAVESLAQLRRAYPNAFLDTAAFRMVLEKIIRPGGQS